jgi:hypothetical protein
MNGNEFDKLLAIQEKSIVAWDRAYNKLEKLSDEIERLTFTIEKQTSNDKKFNMWLKGLTYTITILGSIITAIIFIMKLVIK